MTVCRSLLHRFRTRPDRYQRQGLGTEMLRRLMDVARNEHLDLVSAEILPENTAMQRVSEKVGFTLRRSPRLVVASIQLSSADVLG